MSKESVIYVNTILSYGNFHNLPIGICMQHLFKIAGVNIKPTTDVYAFPQPIAPYSIQYDPEKHAYIVMQENDD